MHQRAGLVEQRGGEADAELDRRDGQPALDDRAGRVPGGEMASRRAGSALSRQLRDSSGCRMLSSTFIW
jgi:hypothetical protein